MEGCIKQNNAIEIYEVTMAFCCEKNIIMIFVDLQCRVEYDYDIQDYFNEVDEATDCEEPRAKTVNLYRCA